MYQRELDRILAKIDPKSPPKLVLHSCCAPCSSYVLEYLSAYFSIVLFYYNPNLYPKSEYERRKSEQIRLLAAANYRNPVTFIDGDYAPERWRAAISGLESALEGGARCEACFCCRLGATAELAARQKADWFCTTLTVSPRKNADMINAVGGRLALEYGVPFLPSEFKKRGGYQRSTELSKQYSLYRQHYCGCSYSRGAQQEEQP